MHLDIDQLPNQINKHTSKLQSCRRTILFLLFVDQRSLFIQPSEWPQGEGASHSRKLQQRVGITFGEFQKQ